MNQQGEILQPGFRLHILKDKDIRMFRSKTVSLTQEITLKQRVCSFFSAAFSLELPTETTMYRKESWLFELGISVKMIGWYGIFTKKKPETWQKNYN